MEKLCAVIAETFNKVGQEMSPDPEMIPEKIACKNCFENPSKLID